MAIDCANVENSGKTSAGEFRQALDAGTLKLALEAYGTAVQSCSLDQQNAIANSTTAQLSADHTLAKTALTFAKVNYDFLADNSKDGITPNRLQGILGRPSWAAPPPPLERQLIAHLVKNFGRYNGLKDVQALNQKELDFDIKVSDFW